MLLTTGVVALRGGGNGCEKTENAPALLLVELVAHALGELLEIALGLCIVGVDHEVLEMP